MNEITGGSCTLEGAKVLAEVANIASTGGQRLLVTQITARFMFPPQVWKHTRQQRTGLLWLTEFLQYRSNELC